MVKWDLSQECKDICRYINPTTCHDIKKMNNKIHMIISIDAEEHFDRIEYMYNNKKHSQQNGYRVNIPQHK